MRREGVIGQESRGGGVRGVHVAEGAEGVDALGRAVLGQGAPGEAPVVLVEERDGAGGIAAPQGCARITDEGDLGVER